MPSPYCTPVKNLEDELNTNLTPRLLDDIFAAQEMPPPPLIALDLWIFIQFGTQT